MGKRGRKDPQPGSRTVNSLTLSITIEDGRRCIDRRPDKAEIYRRGGGSDLR